MQLQFGQELTGLRFGRLLVTSEWRSGGPSKPGRVLKCACDCGRDAWVRRKLIIMGTAKSCGCLRSDNGREQGLAALSSGAFVVAPLKLAHGEAAANALFRQWRKGAKQRGFAWELDKPTFRLITSLPCSYCGTPPGQVFTGKSAFNGPYVHSGIDRIDNAEGYVSGNVAPCCTVCNFMKRSMSVAQFVGHVTRITEHMRRT